MGYTTGSGGTVTQATDKSTAVTLNKPVGRITMNNAALNAGVAVRFLIVNSLVTNADSIVMSIVDGSCTDSAYNFWTATTGGGFYVNIKNISGGSLSEAIQLNFAVVRGITS
jgi:sugar lactone lactonase YvrE